VHYIATAESELCWHIVLVLALRSAEFRIAENCGRGRLTTEVKIMVREDRSDISEELRHNLVGSIRRRGDKCLLRDAGRWVRAADRGGVTRGVELHGQHRTLRQLRLQKTQECRGAIQSWLLVAWKAKSSMQVQQVYASTSGMTLTALCRAYSTR
jgi:hypothetical protein